MTDAFLEVRMLDEMGLYVKTTFGLDIIRERWSFETLFCGCLATFGEIFDILD